MARSKAWIAAAIVGAVIGGLNLGHYVVTSRMDGVATPFGLFPGGLPIGTLLAIEGRALSPSLVVMIVLGLGIVVGAGLSARYSGELTLAKFRARRLNSRKALQAAAGGLLMGLGVMMAQGCLIRHALSGAPGLMWSSWLALLGIVSAIWLAGMLSARRA